MDPLDGVTAFMAVAELESFSAAAEKLGYSKSTVSAQITRLERRIGVRLFQRSLKSVNLTEAGRAYLCKLDDVMDRISKAEKAAQAEATEARGPLRISAPSPFAWTHLAPLLPEFMQLHPDIIIEMQVTAEVVDLIAGGFDLAIRLCPTSSPNNIIRKLGATRLILAAAPALFENRPLPKTPDDLLTLPCLCNSIHPRRNEWRLRRGEVETCLALQPRFVANSLKVLQQLVVAGRGVAVLSEYAVIEDLHAGRLIRLLPDWQIADVPVLAVYPDNRQITAKVRTFVDFLARRLLPEQPLSENVACSHA
jgi:DNA-binding transcriptional LysR family regulator